MNQNSSTAFARKGLSKDFLENLLRSGLLEPVTVKPTRRMYGDLTVVKTNRLFAFHGHDSRGSHNSTPLILSYKQNYNERLLPKMQVCTLDHISIVELRIWLSETARMIELETIQKDLPRKRHHEIRRHADTRRASFVSEGYPCGLIGLYQ